MLKAERTESTLKLGLPYKPKAQEPDKISQVIFVLPPDDEGKNQVVVKPNKRISPVVINFDPVAAAHEGHYLRVMDCLSWYTNVLETLQNADQADRMHQFLIRSLIILADKYPQTLTPTRMASFRKVLGSATVDYSLSNAGISPTNFPGN